MVKKCPYCGMINPDDADFCGNCGKTLTAKAPVVARTRPLERRVKEKKEKIITKLGWFGLILSPIIKFSVFSIISIILLYFMYNPIYDFLYYNLPPVADFLALQFFLPIGHILIIILGLILGLVFYSKGLKLTILSLGLLMIVTILLIYLTPKLTSVFMVYEEFNDILCFITSGDPLCFKEDGEKIEIPSYQKSYDTLRITYDKPVVYAGEPFDLTFYIENLNKKTNGVTFKNLIIGTGEETHVWAYVNRTIGRRVIENPFIFEAQSIDRCNQKEPCELKPEEKIDIYANKFAGGKKNCIAIAYPCIYPCDERDCPPEYYNNIPCKDENIQRLEFEIKVKYDSEVIHQRTLVVAETDEDKERIPAESIPTPESETPTDGPLDLILSFNSPYSLEDRRNYIRMRVDIVNGGNGEYMPKSKIVIRTIGKFPEWITDVEGSSNSICTLSDGKITIDFSQTKFLPEGRSFNCKLNLNKIKAMEEINGYRSILFSGNLNYTYVEKKTFFGQYVNVNRDLCS